MFGLHSDSAAEKILQKAAKLQLEGKTERAKELLQKGARDIPENPQILIQLGTLLFQIDQQKAACAAFKKAHSLFPSEKSELISTLESLHAERGRPVESAELLLELYSDDRKFDQMERILSSLEERCVRSILARYDRTYRNSSKSEESALRRTATLAYVLSAVHSALHDYTKSFEVMDEIITFLPSELEPVLAEVRRRSMKEWGSADLLISLGDLYAKHGKHEDASAAYMRAADSDSSRAPEVLEKIEALFVTRQSEDLVRAMIKLSISLNDGRRLLGLINTLKDMSKDRQEIGRLYAEAARIDPSSFQAHLALGDHYLDCGRLDSAASEYSKAAEISPERIDDILARLKKLLDRDPANERVLEMVFQVCTSSGKLHEAVSFLEAAYDADRGLAEDVIKKLTSLLERDLSHIAGLSLLGRIYTDTGDFESAVPILSYLTQVGGPGADKTLPLLARISDQSPESLECRVALGDAKSALRQFDEALEVYSQAMDSRPERASSVVPRIDLLLRSRRSLARRAVEIYEEKSYLDSFVRHYATAEALGLAQDYSEAAEHLSLCVATLPDSAEQCVASYYRMLEETENPDVRLGLADALAKTERYVQAVEEMNRVVALAPARLTDVLKRLHELKAAHDGPWLREAIVELLLESRLYSEAREEIQSAQKSYPRQSGTWHLALARVNQEAGFLTHVIPEVARAMEQDHSLAPRAIHVLERQKTLDKADLPCLIALARAHTLSGEPQKALHSLKAIAEAHPERTDWVITRLDAISKEEPANPFLFYVRGRLLLERGDVEEAITDLTKASNLDSSLRSEVEEIYRTASDRSPDDSPIQLALARIEVERGAYDVAVRRLTALRKTDPALSGATTRELRRIVDMAPASVGPVKALIDLYMDEQKYESSLELLDMILSQTDEQIPWAIECLREINSQLPENPVSLRLMARIAATAGDLDACSQMYERLLDLDAHELPSALLDVSNLVKQDPTNPTIQFIQARMLVKEGSLETAYQLLRDLVRTWPSWEEKVIEELESLTSWISEPERFSLLQGELLIRRHDYSKALDVLSFWLRHSSGYEDISDFHLLLSHAYGALGKKKKAMKEIRMARATSKSDRVFYQKLLLLREERLSAAVSRCRQELERSPGDNSLTLDLAVLLRKTGELDQAIAVLRKPMEGSLRKRRLLEIARCFLQRGELVTAAKILHSNSPSSPLDTEDVSILRTLATLHLRLGEEFPAIACLRILRETGIETEGIRKLLASEYKQLLLLRYGRVSRALMGNFPRSELTL